MVCWQCGSDVGMPPFCPRCEAIQPFADGTDYFAALGVAQSPALDRTTLDQRYYELSRRLHPDRYQTSAPEAQAASGANTALVNRAYRTLRDPFERGRYWLQLRGAGNETRQTTVPAQLAAIVFEVQEQLDQLRKADAARRPKLLQDVTTTRERIARAEVDAMAQLEHNLAQWSDAPDIAALSKSLTRILADIAYIRALLRDIDKVLDS